MLKRTWGGEVRNVSVLAVIGVNATGYGEIIGVAEGAKGDKSGWVGFLRHLKGRGLRVRKLVVIDACLGLFDALGELYPETLWQRCIVYFYRNVFTLVPKGKVRAVAGMLKAIQAQEDIEAAQSKSQDVVSKLRTMKLPKAAELVSASVLETLTYYHFSRAYRRPLRTNSPLERVLREVRRRPRVVGALPDGTSALMLVAARLRHIAFMRWGTRRYLR